MTHQQEHINLLLQIRTALEAALQNQHWPESHRQHLLEAEQSLKKIVIGRSSKPLIILDLNNVLIDRLYDADRSHDVDHPQATRVGNFLVWTRPHLQSFLDFLFESFDVAVWSSVKAWNIESLLPLVLGDHQSELKFVWSQDQCQSVDNPDPEAKAPLFLKNLSEVWNAFPQYDESNTLIIDDSLDKLQHNPDQCCWIPDKWSRDMTEDRQLSDSGSFRQVLSHWHRVDVK